MHDMNVLRNPFLIYGYESPAYFCGREKETEKLASALRNGRNVTLMSPRRMGKTGLIKNTFYRIHSEMPEAICLYMDIYSTTSLQEFIKLFGSVVLGNAGTTSQRFLEKVRSFIKSCKMVFSANPITGAPEVSLDFQPSESEATLKEIFDYLVYSGKEYFIAIDEFQQIAEYNDSKTVEGLLRSFIQFCPNLHFVFSGSKSHLMSEIFDKPGHPFYRSTEKMHIGVLNMDEYYQFAKSKMETNGIVLSRDAFEKIYNQFCGHTWYIQYMLNKIYEFRPKNVTQEVINECIVDIVESNKEDYQRSFILLTSNQQQLLRAIAKEKNVENINGNEFIKKYGLKGSSSINRAISALINKEYVYRYAEGYQVYDRFMQLWLVTLP